MTEEHQNELSNLKHRITILEKFIASSALVSQTAGGNDDSNRKTTDSYHNQIKVSSVGSPQSTNTYKRRTIV